MAITVSAGSAVCVITESSGASEVGFHQAHSGTRATTPSQPNTYQHLLRERKVSNACTHSQ